MEYMESKMQDYMEAGEHQMNEMEERLRPPYDWQQPKWGEVNRVHNWRNYAPDDLKEEWPNLSGRQRMIIAACLDEMAGNEHWD